MLKIKKYSIIILSLLLASTFLVISADAAGKKPKAKKTLRVLYWNIQNGMWAGQADNYDKFVDWVNKKDPDICIFAEASTIYYDGTNKEKPREERYLPDHWDSLATRFGHSFVRKSAQRDNYPQVVTSKFPIDCVATFVGVKPDTVIAHGAGWFRIQLEGVEKPLNIVTCHLRPFGYGYGVPVEQRKESSAKYEGDVHRRKEAMYLLNHTILKSKDPNSEYWIMAGDFNSRSRKDNFKYKYSDAAPSFMVLDYLMSAKSPYYDIVAESYPGIWCPSHVNKSRIDYILMTKPLMDACVEVYTNTDSYTSPNPSEEVSRFYVPSDHFPIIVDFKLSKLK